VDSAVLAAYIAAGASVVTLAGTTISQRLSSRATSQDNEKTLKQQRDQSEKTLQQQREQSEKTLQQQRDQLETTLADQREQLDTQLKAQSQQLDTQLKAQSDQLDKTLAEQRTRTLNERFTTAADQLGGDKPPAVQLAGVYAMAGLADDWEENRQTCIAVLCGYLRMPYEPDPGPGAAPEKRLEFLGSREVRWTLMRVITEHLRDPQAGSDRKVVGKQVAAKSWQGRNYFDFSGVVFDGGTFSDARFTVDKDGKGGKVDFGRAEFPRSKSKVSFHHAKFSGSAVSLHYARFSGGTVEFNDAEFSGGVVEFRDAEFSDGVVSFDRAKFSRAVVSFPGAEFSGCQVGFDLAEFSGGVVSFDRAQFSGGVVSFAGEFSGGVVTFNGAKFSGGTVDFSGAKFSGGTVDFSHAADWSRPPKFDWERPPAGVKLPAS
jgi:uncharacterized protein YjbI with pentapeptide repeats